MAQSEASIVATLRAAGCVFAEDEARLLVGAASGAELRAMVERRVAGFPLEQVLGWAEFCGLRIFVEPGVFVPRRRTEFLVSQALALLGNDDIIVDLCCGSGAIGAALAAAVDSVTVHAADIDAVAVHCARRNLKSFGGQVHQGDLYHALPTAIRGLVDILAVNAPYVPSDSIALMPPEARDYEARAALDGGPDGVEVQRRVADQARQWLAPGGHLLVETSSRQAPLTAAALDRNGLLTRVAVSEELGATVVIGTNPS